MKHKKSVAIHILYSGVNIKCIHSDSSIHACSDKISITCGATIIFYMVYISVIIRELIFKEWNL